MSTGLCCQFITIEGKDEVFYLLQNGNCPVQVWDWGEYATAYGPFRSMGEAERHLSDNHANPGGWSETTYKAGSDAVVERLITEARTRKRRSKSPYGRSYNHTLRW
jgi:hypothetical protein